jgi:endonuclease YncB( thermonuclease family)
LVLLLVLMALADRAGWLLAKASDDLARYDRVNAIVLRVIDGDTLDIAMADPVTGKDVTRVRLWGIDCPELGRPAQGSSPATSTKPGAEDAMAMSRDLAEHSTVVLVLEAHRLRDRHRRLLAHVDLADGTRLNERLLKAGMARADDRWSHSMQRRYAQLEAAARRTGAGIWAQGQPPSLGAD